VIRRLAARVRHSSHERRADLLLELLRPPTGALLLDLGGADGSFAARLVQRRPDLRITVADVSDAPLRARQLHGFAAVSLDPDEERLPFETGAYDVVLSNSVIEHVTLPRDECLRGVGSEAEWRRRAFARQAVFAQEIRRVGRAWFVQTPHPGFPIDAHTWLPFTSRLHHSTLRRLIRFTDRLWVKRCDVVDWHLLDIAAMRQLFPDATLRVERALGLPKSILAWRAAAWSGH
jgi:hypothetical protein